MGHAAATCSQNEHVVGNTCTKCPPAMTRDAGDDPAAGINTECAHTMCSRTPDPITRNAGGYFTMSDDLNECKKVVGMLNGMGLSWDKVSDLGFGCGDGTILKMGSTVDDTGGGGLTFGTRNDKQSFVERDRQMMHLDEGVGDKRWLLGRYQSIRAEEVGECVLQCPGMDPDLTSVPDFVQDENFETDSRTTGPWKHKDALGGTFDNDFYDGQNTLNCTARARFLLISFCVFYLHSSFFFVVFLCLFYYFLGLC